MRNIALAMGLMAACSNQALAKDGTQTLREALSAIPESGGTTLAPMLAYFFDVKAWRGNGNEVPSLASLIRLALAAQIEPLQRLDSNMLSVWTQKAGVPFADIDYFVGFGERPSFVTMWGLKDETAADGLLTKLKQMDFAEVPGGIPGIFGNGGVEVKMDLRKADPLNPWRGAQVRTYFIKQLGSKLVQASSPETMIALSAPKHTMADAPFVAPALHGLRRTLTDSDNKIIQAVVISPSIGLSARAPAGLVTQQPATADELRDGPTTKRGGLPYYLGGIIADVQGKRPGMTVSLTYSNCDMAEQAVEYLKASAVAFKEARIDADVAGQSVKASQSLCAAIVTFDTTSNDQTANPLLTHFMESHMRRDLQLLRIAEEE
ncbi:hypothetical protein [Shinella oryzae]|uniref:DUF1254 domain-containing protein n=1 Tax=Shinella oryzae TaxID=2871820 RepID=A0ABY9KAG2_9HYPH|nr:hypothetical protein [Shinella oryzae]WLS05004.1 hypothetical protein Q9315_22790 [Shinella oryzae]